MIRSVWCQNCRMVVTTILKNGKEVCPKCDKSVSASTAGEATSVTDSEGEN